MMVRRGGISKQLAKELLRRQERRRTLPPVAKAKVGKAKLLDVVLERLNLCARVGLEDLGRHRLLRVPDRGPDEGRQAVVDFGSSAIGHSGPRGAGNDDGLQAKKPKDGRDVVVNRDERAVRTTDRTRGVPPAEQKRARSKVSVRRSSRDCRPEESEMALAPGSGHCRRT